MRMLPTGDSVLQVLDVEHIAAWTATVCHASYDAVSTITIICVGFIINLFELLFFSCSIYLHIVTSTYEHSMNANLNCSPS